MESQPASHFLRDNALALASLSIAIMGLYLTITSQMDERAHKELLLRPSLVLRVETNDYSVFLVNNGLVPALIRDAVYYVDGQCLALESQDRKPFMAENYTKVVQHVTECFSALVDEIKWKSDWQSAHVFRAAVPIPSQIIGVNSESIIYKLAPEFAKEFKNRLWAFGAPTQRDFNERFAKYALSMPLRIRYCSMSQNFCHTSVMDDLPCTLPD
jgi:hypothetical protein